MALSPPRFNIHITCTSIYLCGTGLTLKVEQGYGKRDHDDRATA